MKLVFSMKMSKNLKNSAIPTKCFIKLLQELTKVDEVTVMSDFLNHHTMLDKKERTEHC